MSVLPPKFKVFRSGRAVAHAAIRAGSALVLCVASLLVPSMIGCGWSYSISAPVIIESQPESLIIVAETTATFAVSVSGGSPLAYQWYRNDVAIRGANASSYTTPAMPLSTSGSIFTVAVNMGPVSSTSAPALLTVTPKKPFLVFIPIMAFSDGATPFSVKAVSDSSAPIMYSLVSGPANLTASLLTATGAGPVTIAANQQPGGDYAGAFTTTTFVVQPEVIISPVLPANLTIGPGMQSFTAQVSNGRTNALSWTATAGSFSGNIWTSPNVAGTYTITAISSDDPTKTASTTIVISPPIITQQPVSGSYCGGSSINLSVAARFADSFQWSFSGGPLSRAVNSTYNIGSGSALLDAGQYNAAAINPAGVATSSAATVIIGTTITSNPQSVSVTISQTATFSVVATGAGPFNYQWYFIPPTGTSGLVIPGAIGSVYTTPALNGTYNGNSYYAVVTDACKTPLTSTVALLTVTGGNVPPTITIQPKSQSIPPFSPADFSVVAVGTPTLSYQWFRISVGSIAGAAIGGATQAQYAVPTSSTNVSV